MGFPGRALVCGGGLAGAREKALKDKRLSITPLEYVVTLFAIRVWLERWEGMGVPERERCELVMGTCDNEATCFVSRRRMAMCPSMAWCTERQ